MSIEVEITPNEISISRTLHFFTDTCIFSDLKKMIILFEIKITNYF